MARQGGLVVAGEEPAHGRKTRTFGQTTRVRQPRLPFRRASLQEGDDPRNRGFNLCRVDQKVPHRRRSAAAGPAPAQGSFDVSHPAGREEPQSQSQGKILLCHLVSLAAQKRGQHRRRRIRRVELHHGRRDEKHRLQAVLPYRPFVPARSSFMPAAVVRLTMYASLHILPMRRHAGGPGRIQHRRRTC